VNSSAGGASYRVCENSISKLSPAEPALRYVHPIVGRELRHGVGFALEVLKSVPQRLNRLRKNAGPGRKDVPQGLKPDVFSIIYGPTKVVP
jgi:hypothetical protein